MNTSRISKLDAEEQEILNAFDNGTLKKSKGKKETSSPTRQGKRTGLCSNKFKPAKINCLTY